MGVLCVRGVAARCVWGGWWRGWWCRTWWLGMCVAGGWMFVCGGLVSGCLGGWVACVGVVVGGRVWAVCVACGLVCDGCDMGCVVCVVCGVCGVAVMWLWCAVVCQWCAWAPCVVRAVCVVWAVWLWCVGGVAVVCVGWTGLVVVSVVCWRGDDGVVCVM